jgi:hypothetical protein
LPFSASRRPKAPEGAGALDRFSSHTILAHNFNRLFAPNKDNLVLRVNYFWACPVLAVPGARPRAVSQYIDALSQTNDVASQPYDATSQGCDAPS